MATIGIHDADFFNYENVIPNLECAKLFTYFQKKREIVVMSPSLVPEKYTKFFVRKEYNDGIYPKKYLDENCTYGGRAFGGEQYIPMDKDIEKIIPDMHIYSKFSKYYTKVPSEENFFKRILNCTHIRLMPRDEVIDIGRVIKYSEDFRTSGIFLHDYDIAAIPNITDILKDISNSRYFIAKPDTVNPYPIGNKYPIKIKTVEEFEKWLDLTVMPRCLFIEYHGLLPDEMWIKALEKNKRLSLQMHYRIDAGCYDENDFLMNRLPEIFKQVLFFLKTDIKILLKYDDDFIKTEELKKLIELLNCWLSKTWQEGFMPQYQTLYSFCCRFKHRKHVTWEFRYVTVTVDEARRSFQYVREHNYELFQMFYNWDSVIFEGGRFISEWHRD